MVAGLVVFARAFQLVDPDVAFDSRFADGESFDRDDDLAHVEGSARSLLAAERTALNLVQRLCGIATLTRRLVRLADGRARVLDTRKTTPGLRLLEKHAVRCGGGENHRMGLYDEIMVKNNHMLTDLTIDDIVHRVRAKHGDVRVTVEARTAKEALAAAQSGADVVMLDNMTVEEMARLCPLIRAAAAEGVRTVEIEASGGVNESNVAEVSGCGVDRVSVGALTHSAPALDLSLHLERIA